MTIIFDVDLIVLLHNPMCRERTLSAGVRSEPLAVRGPHALAKGINTQWPHRCAPSGPCFLIYTGASIYLRRRLDV